MYSCSPAVVIRIGLCAFATSQGHAGVCTETGAGDQVRQYVGPALALLSWVARDCQAAKQREEGRQERNNENNRETKGNQ